MQCVRGVVLISGHHHRIVNPRLHVVGAPRHQQVGIAEASLHAVGRLLFRHSLQLERYFVGIVLPERRVGNVLSLGRHFKRNACHVNPVVPHLRAQHAVVDGRTILRMAPFAHALRRNLQGGHLGPWVQIPLLEDIADAGVQLLGDGYWVALCRLAVGGLVKSQLPGCVRASTGRLLVAVFLLRQLADVVLQSHLRVGRLIAVLLQDGCRQMELLHLAVGSLVVHVFSVADVQPEDDFQRLAEVLLYLVDVLAGLPAIGVRQVGRVDGGVVPFYGESRTYDAHAVKRMGHDAEQSLYQCARRRSRTVREVAVALAPCRVQIAYLSEVGRTAAQVHLVQHRCLQQLEALARTTGLEVGQRHVQVFGRCHVVDAPGVGHPVARAHHRELLVAEGLRQRRRLPVVFFRNSVAQRHVRNHRVHVVGSLEGLLLRTGAAVDGRVDAPQRRVFMHPFQSHQVLVFRPVVLPLYP